MSRRLREIVKPWGVSAQVADIEARHLIIDSRQISHGDLFIALQGHARHGRDFIEAAICQGASAVLVEGERVHCEADRPVPVIELPQLPQRLGEIAACFYGVKPSHPVIAGITGTNGKTSVSHYMAQLLAHLSEPCGVIGTLGFGEPDKLTPLANTTPDLLTLHRLLAEQVSQGRSWVAMEVSSHGLVQNRVASVPFQHAVFTNLSRDHLDYHGTMQAYGEAKAALFDWPGLKSATINHDDPFGRELLNQVPVETLIAYGLEDKAPLQLFPQWLALTNIEPQSEGFSAQLESSWGDCSLSIPLLGRFNLSNVLASIGPLLAAGFELDEVAQAVAQLKPVAGRMESFAQTGKAHCIVDYAHTPDALSAALTAARFHCNGKLWCVFGCGGDRDKGKRPLMAAAAEQHADRIIVTADNPRSEQQADIAADIVTGFVQHQQVEVIHDRHQAIAHAIAQADESDLILIAGKGHEAYQDVAGTRLHFSDREVTAQLLEVAQ